MTQQEWDTRVLNAIIAFNAGDPEWPAQLGRQIADRYSRYYMEVLAKARLNDPDAKVIGLAYQN